MVKKILLIALFLQVYIFQACAQTHQNNEMLSEDFKKLKQELVVLNNQNTLLPIKSLDKNKIGILNFQFQYQHYFDSLVNKYADFTSINTSNYLANKDLKGFLDDVKFNNLLLITVTDSSLNDAENLNILKQLSIQKEVVLNVFGDGNSLINLNDFNCPIIWSSENSIAAAQVVAQVTFGGISINNRLKKDYSSKYALGVGFDIAKTRLTYTVPEAIGLNSKDFLEIDDIVSQAIKEKAAPGAVVLVAKDGNVIFNKAYGSHTYTRERADQETDIFDLASISKIAATTLASMKLYEENKLNLESPIYEYINRTKNTDKANIKVKDVLLHQAGFVPYIPFYRNLTNKDYSRKPTEQLNLEIADSFYISKNYYKDVMWQQMLKTPLKTTGKYVYSDLSMYYMKEIIEGITKKPFPEYLQNNFYDKLGMISTGFNPRNKYPKERIIPTEEDTYFRKTLLLGYVHDQGAAMAGGVAGHAGLFSTATDMAIFGQLLLNKGSYGGEQYFKPETVDLFTNKYSDISRRGLGFDRWDPDTTKKYPSNYASNLTFGHTGYTGTCVWIDPKSNLTYVFLSNRVYPQVTNKLSDLNIRSRIQDVIYKAINKN